MISSSFSVFLDKRVRACLMFYHRYVFVCLFTDGSTLYLSFTYLVYLEIVTVTVRVTPSPDAVSTGIAGG